MNEPPISIILRSFNEGWALRETLPALQRQSYRNWDLIVFDSGSSDDSVEQIRAAQPRHFIQMAPSDYQPGRVLNHGMRLAQGAYGIFLNADATPQGDDWLRPLVEALLDAHTAAVFGRQIPRPDCRAVYACDYDRCFGARRESTQWDHFFSMVSSGVRKDIWAQRGFLEHLKYAEDDEYTRWCKAQGYRVAYCSESVVMHSHNYSPGQAYQRSLGDSRTLALTTPEKVHPSWTRTVLLGWMNDLRRDLLFCVRNGCATELAHAAWIRWKQRQGKRAGFKEGLAAHRQEAL